MKRFSLISSPLSKDFEITLSRTRATFQSSLQTNSQHLQSHPQSRGKDSVSDRDIKRDRDAKPSPFILSYIQNDPSSFNYMETLNDNISKQKQAKLSIAIASDRAKQTEKQGPSQYQKEKTEMFERGKELKQRMEILMAFDNQKSDSKNKVEQTFPNGYVNIDIPLLPCAISKPDSSVLKSAGQNGGGYLYGLIESIGFCYYAVENVVYFQDLVYRVQHSDENRNFRPQKVEFKRKVLSIKEGQFKSSLLSSQDRVFVLQTPNGISICKYTLRNRELQIFQEGVEMIIPALKSQLHLTKCKRIFYFTVDGHLREVEEQILSRWRNPFRKRRYYLKSQEYHQKFQGFLKRATSGSVPEAIKQFANYFKRSLESLVDMARLERNRAIINSVMNEKIKQIACLVHNGLGVQLRLYSFNQKIQCLAVLPEKQICQILDINREDYYFNLELELDIPSLRQPDSDFVIVLKSGERVHLQVANSTVRRIGEMSPPSIESYCGSLYNNLFEQDTVCSRQDQFTPQHLVNYQSSNKSTFMSFTGPKSRDVYSYFVYKQDLFLKQTISCLKFQILDQEEDQQYLSYPQIKLGSLPQSLIMGESYGILFKLEEEYLGKNMRKTGELHELASQVHFNSQVFLFGNKKGTQLKYKMRLIDVMFMVVFCDEIRIDYIEGLFARLIEDLKVHPSEIASMLLQILIDKNGVYEVERGLMEKTIFMRSKNTTKKGSYQFQALKPQRVRFTHRHLNRDKWKKIDLLLYSLSKQNVEESIFKVMMDINLYVTQSMDSFYHSNTEPRDEGIILYFTRLVRPLWYIPLKEIQLYENQFKNLLQRFQEVYSYLKVKEIGKSLGPKATRIQQTFKSLIERVFQVFQVCKVLDTVPEISFSDCLYSTPEEFQQHIVGTVIKGQSIEKLKKEFKRISAFIGINTFKALEMYQNLHEIQSVPEILSKIKEYKCLPVYLHDYLLKYKHFPASIKLRVTPSFNPLQPQTERMKERSPHPFINTHLHKLYKELESKRGNSKDRLQNTQEQIKRIKDQIKILYVQNVLLLQLQNQSIELSPSTIYKLKETLLDQAEIRSIVMSVSSKLSDVVFLLNLSNQVSPQLISQLILEDLDGDNPKREMMNRITYILSNTFQCHSIKRLLMVVLKVLSQYHSRQKKFLKGLSQVLRGNSPIEKGQEIQMYWVGFAPLQFGYSSEAIEQGLFDLISQEVIDSESENEEGDNPTPLEEMFSWILCYVYFLKEAHSDLIEERRRFLERVIQRLRESERLSEEEIQRVDQYIHTLLTLK